MVVELILVVSVLLQLAAAVLALRLIRITGNRRAWVWIAAAVLLMVVRRGITLYNLVLGDTSISPDLLTELVALASSVFMVVGMAWIAPLFLSIKLAKEEIQRSEASLAHAQRMAHLGSWEWDVPADKGSWSDEVYRIFGLTPHEFEVSFKTFFDLVHPSDRETVRESVDKALHGAEAYAIDHRIVRPNGSERIVHEAGEATLDESGRAIWMVGTVHDITERKLAELEVQSLHRYNRGLIEVNPDPFVTFDENGTLLDVNEATVRVTGRGREELIGTPFADHFTDPERAHRGVTKVFENRGVHDYDLVLVASDGTEVAVTYNASPYNDQSGEMRCALAVARDITERKKAADDLKKAADTATLYLDLMGHDIRNHLQAIVMGTDIMKNTELSPQAQPMFDIIVESVERSQNLIKKIQATRGLLSTPLSSVSLEKSLEDSLRTVRANHEDVHIEVRYESQRPHVRADRFLRYLLMNIMENAVLHNDRRVKRLWVTLSEAEGGYEISIADNGQGISDGRKKVLFDPSRRFGGVGIHQAQTIVQKYDGQITVHDRVSGDPGQGADFRVWFPRA